ncbi:amidohydrolase [Brachybacterium sp. ACRRE]|uniref:amidohydrolase family protein n=1 Tax=Brachybacterium sp. ACRRE TaxID=2918184 RepID=UPI001EF1D80C|nr:amidohydrolase family protein [Brachybacterium sp. ACRRE]MCG7310304.1 amidohydrolase family protein [Brachybacterium sp. ACRRE]
MRDPVVPAVTDDVGARMGVTDAHLHLWDLQQSPYAWLAGAPEALRRTGEWSMVRDGLAALDVTRVILVQADDTPADTAHLQRTARAIEAEGTGTSAANPRVTADVVGWLPLEDPDAVADALADPAVTDHLVGVRHLVHDEPDPGFLERPAVGRSLELLAAAGLPLDVPDAFPRHMEQVVRLAAAHPELTLVLDHLGKPPLGDGEQMAFWRAALERIAAAPRAVAKISGLATSGNGAYVPAVASALELFGPGRLMVGSDWPIAPSAFTLDGFSPLLAHVRAQLAGDDEALGEVLRGTAERVYRRAGSPGETGETGETGAMGEIG